MPFSLMLEALHTHTHTHLLSLQVLEVSQAQHTRSQVRPGRVGAVILQTSNDWSSSSSSRLSSSATTSEKAISTSDRNSSDRNSSSSSSREGGEHAMGHRGSVESSDGVINASDFSARGSATDGKAGALVEGSTARDEQQVLDSATSAAVVAAAAANYTSQADQLATNSAAAAEGWVPPEVLSCFNDLVRLPQGWLAHTYAAPRSSHRAGTTHAATATAHSAGATTHSAASAATPPAFSSSSPASSAAASPLKTDTHTRMLLRHLLPSKMLLEVRLLVLEAA